MSDDLHAPLGLRSKRLNWKRWPLGLVGLGLIATMIGGAALWTAFFPDTLGGEPTAVARIDRGKGGVTQADVAVGDKPKAGEAHGAEAPPSGPASLTEARPPEGQKAVLTPMEPGKRPGLPAEGQPLTGVPVAKITDKGKFGPLPRIAQDGTRALEAYARPAQKRPAATPRVVVVVGGLGLSQTGTQEAIRLLPADVTLAFAPYGASLDRWMQRARQDGHEVLLQLPMEPFDYPDNDPGPHTLLTGLTAEQNIERMHWILSRLTNYVGVVNYMGARFTAEEARLTPIFRELSARGIMYLDDGSSGRSVAEVAARAARLPFARTDVVIDAVATEAAIDARLTQLENIARQQGVAVGFASALPISLRKLSDWSKTLESRGVVIVPASSVARDGQSG
ncbi:divergent polysaccharide deacetylase family protein [Prosthecomicrobium sp. N25]|uniref:divergent polysaccharide deacetylase family protein n=1 Tax=Prosthecomicrobium sp. N25 TaxID=3129254 RepID=UPI003077763E